MRAPLIPERSWAMNRGITGWMDSLRRPRPMREERQWDRRRPHAQMQPANWEGLSLVTQPLAQGSMLEVFLATYGEEVGRCLARQDGTFLREPTGPTWVRAMLVEAVAEWRLEAAGPIDP